MGQILTLLTRFVGASSKALTSGGALNLAFAGVSKSIGLMAGGILAATKIIGGAFIDAMSKVVSIFTQSITKAIGFDLSIQGFLDQAEETRRFFSELADEMNFYSSSTGSTTKAMGILMDATGKSTASMQTLKGAFQSMVDAGADSDQFIKDMLPTLGDFETKTGVGAQQFAMLSTKFQQMFGEKKGITKDIKDLQKALIGTGLKGAQLEQTMQGLTESSEKLAFATRGATLDIKELSNGYSKSVAAFKAFGISAQTTSSFLNGLLDPESIEKNMLLMNKMGISYGEFNDMLNSGKGQTQFFDKILKNVGDVAKEANMIEDASTRYKYLKDTLNLPPEIANKLMKVSPHRMQSELKKIKREMEDAEKRDKWKKDLKAREEKYEEQMRFLRMQMVAPLVDLIQKNRGTMAKFAKAIVPVMQGVSRMIKNFLTPFLNWLDAFSEGLDKLKNADTNTIVNFAMESLKPMWATIQKSFSDVWNSNEMQSAIIPFMDTIGKYLTAGIKFAVHKATGGSWFGDDKTFKDIVKDLDKEEEEKKTENKEKGNDSINTSASQNIKDKNLRDKVNFTVGPGRYDTAYDAQQRAIKSMTDDIRKLDLNKPINDATLQELKKNNSGFKNFNLDDLTKMVNSIKEYEKENALAIERFKSLNGAETLEESKEFIENQKKRAQENADIENDLDRIRRGGKDKPIVPKVKGQDIKTSPSTSLPGSTGGTNEGGSTESTNPEVIALKKSLLEQQVRIDNLNLSLEESKKAKEGKEKGATFENLYNNLFGESGDSIKNILVGILTTLDDEHELNKKKDKKNKGTLGITEKDLNTINATNSVTSYSGISANATASAADSVKGIQAKQTLYLKAISESTHASANYLKYIGSNLIFTNKGLVVDVNRGDVTNWEGRDIHGTKKPKGSVLSNFSVLAP